MPVFKFLILFAIFVLLSFLVGGMVFDRLNTNQKIDFGITFSPGYAKYLQLDWQKTYLAVLDDLKVRNLRIPTYWDILETKPDQFNFAETDFMLEEAGKRGARVVMVLGLKQPRWPECHIPAWAKNLKLEDRQQKILGLIQKIVDRYKDNPAVWAWQIENEPFLPFGEDCDSPDKSFLKKEANLVRSLSNKDIIMTDSGELGFWTTSMSLSDIFGTTLYRQVYDRFLGYVTYPLPPAFYSIKSSLIRNIFARSNKKTIIVELQTEPWLADGVFVSSDQQAERFTTKSFKDYIKFAQRTGFDEAYLWGVEWWYFMDKNGHPEYLNFAKSLFK